MPSLLTVDNMLSAILDEEEKLSEDEEDFVKKMTDKLEDEEKITLTERFRIKNIYEKVVEL